MSLRRAVLFAVILSFVSISQQEASAAGRRGRLVQPNTAPATVTSGGPTTILPSVDEIRAVPAPGGGRLIGYGLTVHPGARVARMIIGR